MTSLSSFISAQNPITNNISSSSSSTSVSGHLTLIIFNPIKGATYQGNKSINLNATYTNDSPISFSLSMTLNQPDGISIPLGGPFLSPTNGKSFQILNSQGNSSIGLPYDLSGPLQGAYNLTGNVQYFSGINSTESTFSLDWIISQNSTLNNQLNNPFTFTLQPTGSVLDFGGGNPIPTPTSTILVSNSGTSVTSVSGFENWNSILFSSFMSMISGIVMVFI